MSVLSEITPRGFREVINPEKPQSIKEWDGDRPLWDKAFYPIALAQQWELPSVAFTVTHSFKVKYENAITAIIDTHFKDRLEWLLDFNIKMKSKYFITENKRRIILVIEFANEYDAVVYKLVWAE
jgi:hypothetical protein